MRYLLGLDVGGGGGRAILLDARSGAVTSAFRAWMPDGEADVDLEAVWAALADAARETLARSGIRPTDVSGISATSMRLGAVLLDGSGRALHAGWNRDMRAIPQGLALGERHGPALARTVGRWPIPNCLAARLHWLAQRDPRRLEAARSALALSDWVVFRLCGERATDFSQAAETLLLDVRKADWAHEWIERLGLPAALFPPIVAAGTRLGTLQDAAAADLGLRAGVPIAVGGGDTQCGLLGSGARAHADLAVVAGTTAPLQQVLAHPVVDAETRLWSGLHVVPGRWVLESNAGPLGEALDWLAHLLYPEAPVPAAALLDDVGAAPAGAAGVLSTFGATVFDARALRPSYGCLSLPNLGVGRGAASRALVARGAVEGMVHTLRVNFDQICKVSGETPEEVRLCGGLARSAAFAQLLADGLGRPASKARVAESSGLGAALCAGVGSGLFRDLDEAAAALAGGAQRFEPDLERARILAERHVAWERLRRAQPDIPELTRWPPADPWDPPADP